MFVLVKEAFVLIVAAIGFLTLTTTSIIIYTQEGEEVEINYNQLAEKWKENVEEELDERIHEYENLDEIKEATFSDLLKEIETEHEIEITIEQEEEIAEELNKRVPVSFWNTMEKHGQDIIKEQESYRKDPWGYNGISPKDFLK